MTNPGESTPPQTADGTPMPPFMQPPEMTGSHPVNGSEPSPWGSEPSPWGPTQDPFNRGEQSPFHADGAVAPEPQPTPEPQPEPRPATHGDGGVFDPDLLGGFSSTSAPATPGEDLDVPGFMADDGSQAQSPAAPTPPAPAQVAPAPDSAAATPENTSDTGGSSPDDGGVFDPNLHGDFSSTSAPATPGEDLDVPGFMADDGSQAQSPSTPAPTPPPAAPTASQGGFLTGALNRQNGGGGTPAPTPPAPAAPFPVYNGPLAPPRGPAYTPPAARVPVPAAAPNTAPTPPAPVPAPAPPVPSRAPAPHNTAPTLTTRAESQAALVLQGAEDRANQLGTSVGEVLTYETTRARQEFAKQIARHGTTMVGGSKKLMAAQEAYRAAVDAEGIYAISQVEASTGYAMSDSEIRAFSVLGNLGDGNMIGEEEKLVSMIRMQQLMRAGYKPEMRTETLAGNDDFKLEVVDNVTEPTGFRGVQLKVTRAFDKLGNNKAGKVARAVLVGATGAAAVLALTGAAAATGGGAFAIAAGAFSGRLSRGVFATRINEGSRDLKANAEYDDNIREIEARRTRGQGAVATYDEIANGYLGNARLERGDTRRRAIKTGAIAVGGTLAAYGGQWLMDQAGKVKDMLPSFGTGSSGAQHPGASHPSGTPSHDASPSDKPSGGASPEASQPSRGGTANPEASNGSGSGSGSGSQGSGENTGRGTGDAGSGNESDVSSNPDAHTITPGSAGTLSEDFHNAGIGFDKVATAANELIEKGELGKHIINGDPNNYYYTGGSRAQIEAAIFQQMVDNGSIDPENFKLAA